MFPSEIKSKIREKLESYFRIDGWGLNLPPEIVDVNNPPNIAREKPVTTFNSLNQVHNWAWRIEMTVTYQLLYRVPSAILYDDVLTKYREPLDNALTYFCINLNDRPECVGCDEITTKFKTSVVQDKTGDWLVSGQIEVLTRHDTDYRDIQKPTFL